MKNIKYGIIGCGGHALDGHAMHGKDIPGLELVAVCDVNEENLSMFEKTLGVNLQKFNNPHEFFCYEDMDATLIATPDQFHLENLSVSLEARLHTFIEKPLAVSSKELEIMQKLLAQARENKLVVTSCHPRRFDPPFVYVKEHLNEWIEKFGQVLKIDFDFSYHRSSQQWKENRSLLLDHANHEIDLVNWLFGHSDFDAKKLADGHDFYQVIGKRADGISFDFIGSRRLSSREFIERLRIRFERGDTILDSHSGKFISYDHESSTVEEIKVGKTDYSLRGQRVMQNFVDSIRNPNVTPYLSFDDLYANTSTSVMLKENPSFQYKFNKV